MFPLFLLLFLGMLELGNAWMASSAAAAAAKEAAEVARRDVPFSPTGAYAKANDIAQSIVGRWVWDRGFVLASTQTETVAGEQMLTVTVNVNYNLITGGFLRTIPFGAFDVFGDGRMRVERSASVLVL